MVSAVSRVRHSGLLAIATGGVRIANPKASAAACSRPLSLRGGSRRPRSRPLALASVSPWRASTSVLTTKLSLGDRLQPAAAPELAARPGQVEVELADHPPA